MYKKKIEFTKDMNGDQGTTKNNSFTNVPKKITIHKG